MKDPAVLLTVLLFISFIAAQERRRPVRIMMETILSITLYLPSVP